MKRIFGILFALLLVACLGLLTQVPDRTGGPAYAAGAQPMALAGIASTITPAGPVPAGTLVQAYVGTELRAETTTEAEGLYRNLLVPGPGGTVTFRVAGVLAQESIMWESGEIMDDFDLTIPALPSAGYSLTMAVSPAGTGTATDVTGACPYAAGEVVSIQAVPATGYQFSHWTAAPAVVFGNANAASTTFPMPAQDVTVTAYFEEVSPQEVPTVTTQAATDISSYSAFVNMSYTAGDFNPVEVRFACKRSTDPAWFYTTWVSRTADGTYTDVLIGLISQTEYEFKAQLKYNGTVIEDVTRRFTTAPEPEEVTETVTNGTIDARAVADTEVEVTGTATVTVARYKDNPGGPPPTGSSPLSSLDKYIDVYSPDTKEATEFVIKLYYTDAELAAAGIDEESLRLFWWNGTAWVQCSDGDVNTTSTKGYSGYMWAEIRETDTTPTLSQLTGTPFGGYGHPTEVPPICCTATVAAASGTNAAKKLDMLREFRDEVMLPDASGAEFVSLYYKTSPPIANFISQHEVLRTLVRMVFIDPIVAILDWSHDLWSERGS
jgi:hypothetical protein